MVLASRAPCEHHFLVLAWCVHRVRNASRCDTMALALALTLIVFRTVPVRDNNAVQERANS
eukprot:11212572-Lingulodinium_polyedra.AAC.1